MTQTPTEIAKELLDNLIKERMAGEVVPNGWSVTVSRTALHVKWQIDIGGGQVVRVRLRIPKKTPLKWSTWHVEEVRHTYTTEGTVQ